MPNVHFACASTSLLESRSSHRSAQIFSLKQGRDLFRVLGDFRARGFEEADLVRGRPGAAFDDPRRRGPCACPEGGLPCDKCNHRLRHAGSDVVGSLFLVGAADLADQHDLFGLGIVLEHLEHVDEVRAVDRVAADAHARGSAHADELQRVGTS